MLEVVVGAANRRVWRVGGVRSLVLRSSQGLIHTQEMDLELALELERWTCSGAWIAIWGGMA